MTRILKILYTAQLFSAWASAQYTNGTITSPSGASYPVSTTSDSTLASSTTAEANWSSLEPSSPLSYTAEATAASATDTASFEPNVPHSELSATSSDVTGSTAVAPAAETSDALAEVSGTGDTVSSTTATSVPGSAPVEAVNGTAALPLGTGMGDATASSSKGFRPIIQPTATALTTRTPETVAPVASAETSSSPSEPAFSFAPETSLDSSTLTSSLPFSYAPALASSGIATAGISTGTEIASSTTDMVFSFAPVPSQTSSPDFVYAPSSVTSSASYDNAMFSGGSTTSASDVFAYDHHATTASSSSPSSSTTASSGLLTVSVNNAGHYMLGSVTMKPDSAITQGEGASATVIALEETSGSTALVVQAPQTTASAFLPNLIKTSHAPESATSTSQMLEYDSASGASTYGRYKATGTSSEAASEAQATTSYPPGTLSNGACAVLVQSRFESCVFALMLSGFVLLQTNIV